MFFSGGWGRLEDGEIFLVSDILCCMYLVLLAESYLKSRSSTENTQKKRDIHLKAVSFTLVTAHIKFRFLNKHNAPFKPEMWDDLQLTTI